MRSSLLVFGLSLSSLSLFASPGPTRIYELGKLSNWTNGQLRLAGNRPVTFRSLAASDIRVIFEDLHPRANWGHPAAIRVVNGMGKVLEEIKVNAPPVGLERYRRLSDFLSPTPTPVKVQLKANAEQKVSDPTQHFAVLINGNASQRHWNDFSFLFQTLTQVYGYRRENIWVADSFHKQELPDLDGDGQADILYESTIEGVRALLTELKGKTDAQSEVLIVVNDHGETKDDEAVLILNDGAVKASDFAKWLKELPSKKMVQIYQQCFGGGFVRPSVGEYRVALAASTSQEFSWATSDMQFDEFLYHLTSALAGQTHEGKRVGSDLNRDGRISISEAFLFASAKDSTAETPLLESYPNSGFDKLLGLNF